ncbi:MAG: monovalent cation/H(+) antiporter subunit G [Candidatus Dormibacterales bacterium]
MGVTGAWGAASAGLLAAGTAVVALSCLGVLSGRTAYDKLHFTGPTSVLGIPLIAAAVVAADGFNTAGVMACLVALTALCLGPLTTHVVGRSLRVRAGGRWEVTEPGRSRGRARGKRPGGGRR